MTSNYEFVWVFNGNNTSFPSAVFKTEESAIQWIKEHKLSGTLTQYPLGISAYDHAINTDQFKVRKEHEKTSRFMVTFSPRTPHSHWDNGVN